MFAPSLMTTKEMCIRDRFKDEGYTYLAGEQIHRERTEVLLADDLRQYLYSRYAKDGITPVSYTHLTSSGAFMSIFSANLRLLKEKARENSIHRNASSI